MGTTNGIGVSMWAYLESFDSWDLVKVHCRIYDSNLNFVAKTKERSFYNVDDGWYQFEFANKPTLKALSDYYLCVWAGSSNDSISRYVACDDSSGNIIKYQSSTYDYDDESQISLTDFSGFYDARIYCEYMSLPHFSGITKKFGYRTSINKDVTKRTSVLKNY